MAAGCGKLTLWALGPCENPEKGGMMDAEQVKQIVKEVLPRIEKLMALEVATWEQLTIEQRDELNIIMLGGLERIDIKRARVLGLITNDEYGKLMDFSEWEKALG